jgi:hypothetical protein
VSIRLQSAAAAAMLFASLSGASLPATAADTKPIVKESCPRAVQVANRGVAGHPGKSLLRPKRTAQDSVQCSQDGAKPLILASFTDARGGVALERGNTERAVELIHGRKYGRPSSAELTNLCVARTVLRQFDQAREVCDAALSRALADRASHDIRFGASRIAANQAVAVAYSNRSVMNWLVGDAVAAHHDIVAARALAPWASFVSRNLELTERAPSLVRSVDNHAPIG